MPYAYAGRILHVDLTKRKCMIEPLNFVYARKYIGGKGLAARYFFDLWKLGMVQICARLGCPPYSIMEIRKLAALLKGKKIHKRIKFWIYTTKHVES